MRAVGLKVLKNKLSEYVRLAAGGETVVITDRNRVVAELGPPAAGRRSLPDDVVLAKLERQGVLTPATDRTGKPPPRDPVMSFDELMRDLERDRAD